MRRFPVPAHSNIREGDYVIVHEEGEAERVFRGTMNSGDGKMDILGAGGRVVAVRTVRSENEEFLSEIPIFNSGQERPRKGRNILDRRMVVFFLDLQFFDFDGWHQGRTIQRTGKNWSKQEFENTQNLPKEEITVH